MKFKYINLIRVFLVILLIVVSLEQLSATTLSLDNSKCDSKIFKNFTEEEILVVAGYVVNYDINLKDAAKAQLLSGLYTEEEFALLFKLAEDDRTNLFISAISDQLTEQDRIRLVNALDWATKIGDTEAIDLITFLLSIPNLRFEEPSKQA